MKIAPTLSLSLLLTWNALASASQTVELGTDIWRASSAASALVSHEPVQRLVRAMESANGVLVIRHASGEDDRARADALRAALVALGIPSAQIRLEPAAAAPGILVLEQNSSRLSSP